MCTGSGKTATSAGIIKLFLRTENAKRILFLVDRIELEEQADKAFKKYLKNDYTSVIWKEKKDEWKKAEIVVSTIQSFMFNNKYKRLFHPTDFDLVISDEAHRSIGGNSRSVFEYFIGYKLGLTATPKDYLKKIEKEAYLKGNIIFREWTDSISPRKNKLNESLQKIVLEEGRYDKITNQISSTIFRQWKEDFENGKESSRIDQSFKFEDNEIETLCLEQMK
jgi:type I site-specific restriction-modification system R (restriction) subunit